MIEIDTATEKKDSPSLEKYSGPGEDDQQGDSSLAASPRRIKSFPKTSTRARDNEPRGS
jgi:hypothetical protein